MWILIRPTPTSMQGRGGARSAKQEQAMSCLSAMKDEEGDVPHPLRQCLPINHEKDGCPVCTHRAQTINLVCLFVVRIDNKIQRMVEQFKIFLLCKARQPQPKDFSVRILGQGRLCFPESTSSHFDKYKQTLMSNAVGR